MSDFLDQFDKVPNSQKLLLLVLLMFGIGVGYFFLFQSEIEEQIEQERNRYTTLSNQSAQLRAGADDIDRIRAEIQELCERQSTFLEKPVSHGIFRLDVNAESGAVDVSALEIVDRPKDLDAFPLPEKLDPYR